MHEPHRTAAGRDAVRHQPVEKLLRSRPRHPALRERGHVQQADILRHVATLAANVLEPARAAERPVVHRLDAFRREPVRPLPAELLAEDCAQRLQPVVARSGAQRPRGGPLLVRVVDGEDVGVRLLVLLHQIRPGRVVAEAARVDPHHVDGRLALHDPLRELEAGTAGRGDPEAVALVEPEVVDAPRGADDGAPVRGVADGAVERLLHPHLAECGHPVDGGLDVRLQALQVLLEQLVLAVLGGAVHVAGGSADLVGAEDQPTPLLAQVPGAVGLAQHSHFRQSRRVAGLNLRVRLGHDVLVLYRNDRHVQAHHRPGAPREAPGGAHHVLADDVALVGVHAPLGAGGPGDSGHDGVAVNLRAPVPCTGGECLGQIRRLHVAVPGMADRSDQAVDVAQRPDLLDLLRGQEVDVDPDGACHARVLAVLVHPVAVHGETDIADESQPHVLPGLLPRGVRYSSTEYLWIWPTE